MSEEQRPAARLLGAVLAGGESRRFGSDKATARLGGTTLVERAAETLARVFGDVVIVSSRRPVTDRWPRVQDERSGAGPLAGIEAALLEARRRGLDGAFVLACDMPFVDEHTVRAVVDALGADLASAPAPNGGPDIEPLCAAYRVECMPEAVRRLDEGRLAVHELFAAVGGRTVALSLDESPGRFVNVNTPADHARARAVLPEEPRGDAG